MSTSTLSFTGVSTFSNDFQTILARGVAIANLPLKALQNQQLNIVQQKASLITLNSAVADVGSSLAALGALASSQSLAANTSDATKVTVQDSGATAPASYVITNITSVASAASETSKTGYADAAANPVSATGSLSLVVGTQAYPITLTAKQNNLNGLRDAINSQNAGVTATILTTGTGTTPNYLSITNNATGETTLQLNDQTAGGPVNVISAINQGTNAAFQLNGIPVNRSTNSVNDVIPGLTFTILGTTTAAQPVTVSLATDRTQLGTALQDFATKYNALALQVNSQVGTAAGLLSGDFVIRQIQTDLRQVTSYQGVSTTSSIRGLANLGLSLDINGKISFDSTTLNALSTSQLSDAFQFLGSPKTGLGALTASFTQLSDPTIGLIRVEEDGIDKTNVSLTDRIATMTDHIKVLTASLTAQLQTADALIAGLQSQQTILTASVQSANLALFGKDFGVAQALNA